MDKEQNYEINMFRYMIRKSNIRVKQQWRLNDKTEFHETQQELKNQKEWWLTRERKPVWGSPRLGDGREGNGTMENPPEGMNWTSYKARRAWTMKDLRRKAKERESNRDNEKWKGKNRKQILLKIGNGGKKAINAPRRTVLSDGARRRETIFRRVAGTI